MTRDEILQHARDSGLARQYPGHALEVVELARAIERQVREDCARAVEDAGQSMLLRGQLQAGKVSKAIAVAIRNPVKPEAEKQQPSCCAGGPQWGHAYDCWMMP